VCANCITFLLCHSSCLVRVIVRTSSLMNSHVTLCQYCVTACTVYLLASCLINAQPLPVHSPATDDNSLIGCTSHDLTDDWSLASTHFDARLGAFFY